eukprot:scaffold2836_cov99-Cylindrotheca_fusiformis.AAC.2
MDDNDNNGTDNRYLPPQGMRLKDLLPKIQQRVLASSVIPTRLSFLLRCKRTFVGKRYSINFVRVCPSIRFSIACNSPLPASPTIHNGSIISIKEFG